MLFNSFEYVLFLAVVFTAYWALARHGLVRVVLLLVASCVFYMSWNATFIVLVAASTALDYFVGLGLGRTDDPRYRKGLLAMSVGMNLGLLGLFKYADFFLEATSETLGLFGIPYEPSYLRLVLPVGISFYTFQTLSYSIDVYRREIEPTRSFLEFATFVTFFPQLVAGPIVRAKEFLPQFRRRPALTVEGAGEGFFLILKGMTKKVGVADFLAVNFVDRVFEAPGNYSSLEIVVALLGYGMQIYCDFSGYTDIACGSARLLGFELPENFNRPFAATGPIDFWRRWHLTLSTWVRDYLYVPLGGSRHGLFRKYVNTFVSFLIMGIWHGAGWTFVLFGLYHATTVSLNHMYRDYFGKRPEPTGLRRAGLVALHMTFFTLHWPLFRAPDVSRMVTMYQKLFELTWVPHRVPPAVLAVILGAYIVHYTRVEWRDAAGRWFMRQPGLVQAGAISAVALLLAYVGARDAAPFIYFQF
jgi:D-alanyl-lipoteichoic acid acyltransferase DltB (MBOAT superfamily)